MLLCRRDRWIGLLALKSLLRFPDAHLAVTLTDDGSLTEADRRWFDRHVPGCRWLPRHVSDPRLDRFLADHPRLKRGYDGGFPLYGKLLHPLVLNQAERVIVCDSDTAFFRRPERLLQWARGQDAHGWYLHHHQNQELQVPNETREAFKELAERCSHNGTQWRMDYYFFNSGLLAFRPSQLNLDLAEVYLAWLETASARYHTGQTQWWFCDWTPEQMAYQCMFALMDPPAKPLGDDYYIGGDAGHVFNHFLRHSLRQKQSLKMLSEFVESLKT